MKENTRNVENGLKGKRLFCTLSYFSYLYAGSVLHTPYTSAGAPMWGLVATGLCVMASAYGAAHFLKTHTQSHTSSLAMLLSVLLCAYSGAAGAQYVDLLSVFDRDYSGLYVIGGAAIWVVLCGGYAAFRGWVCLNGTALLAIPVFAVWTVVGAFAFLSIGQIQLSEVSFMPPQGEGVWVFLAETVYMCADAVLGVFCLDEKSKEEKAVCPRVFLRGAGIFVFVSGIELIRSLLLFGQTLTAEVRAPELVAIRLVPGLELPEISVLVHTFAVVIKLGFYLYLAQKVLEADGLRISKAKHRLLCTGTLLSLWLFLRCRHGERLTVGAGLLAFALIVGAVCLAFCSYSAKKERKRK